MKYQMARGEFYEIPSEESHPGEPSTKRNIQQEKEEDIYDNPTTNGILVNCKKRSECSTHLTWKDYKSKLEVGDQDA
ncbi:hypothetical protein L5515_013628 [Caenorhabditis briggsae]|uniref:Uncharacterized protein n=1 Tax=Caenorhabditis briggsae TaxID=6238 RepID=A0AAE9J7A5_CAEBR|nr:hypothetical protein L5515_013628 [Caenorhabditis briggsae]